MNPKMEAAKASPPPTMGQWIRFRLGFVFVTFVAVFALVAFRLVQLQIIVNPALEALAERQFQKIGKKSPYRLPIYDRNREELAVSIPASSVFARPRLIRKKRYAARVLAKVLGESPSHWLQKLTSDKPFVWLHRKLSEDLAKRLAHQNLPGIFIEPENKRIYPNGELAAPVLGFTDIDGNGLSGLELSLNEELLQKESKIPFLRDGRGNPSYIDSKYLPPDDGTAGVYTTIDRRLQHAVEEELDRSIQETGARAVMAVVMDPFTGEIFALGQRPTFDPNRANQFPSNLWTNRFISHLYEPGSTMKVLLAAEAIQDGLMTAKTPIDCENGQIFFGKRKIGEAESDHRYGILPLEKVIRYSSNVGAVKVAEALGVDRVRSTLDKFGLTSRTGISLPGEAVSAPKGDDYWKPIFLATVGFGQGVSVNPLQMVSSFAPFANGGYLVRPRILMRENVPHEHLEVRRVLAPSTVQAMREILVGVTEEKGGTGVAARIADVRIAGKTGTAQKYEPGVGYDSKKYFSSFIGFLPAEQPELLIGVMVDEPRKTFYASQVAAPLFKRIAERSLQILDKIPKRSINQKVAASVVPAHPIVQKPEPAPQLDVSTTPDGKWVMPDLKGASMRDALRSIGKYMGNVKISGNGYLESQSPKAGTVVSSHSAVILHFSPAG